MQFEKYRIKGAYHWNDISINPSKRNAFVVARYGNIISLLKKHCNHNLKQKKILDLGCGDGVLSYLIAKEGAVVSGIDLSETAINFAKIKTKKRGLDIDFRQENAYELPFMDEEFDAVVSSDVIEHIEDVHIFLKEIHRVLKLKGVIVISTPIKFSENLSDRMHVTEWFPKEYQELIEEEFPDSQYFKSHPVFWLELFQRSKYFRLCINLLSLMRNPFSGFKNSFKYMALQYSVSFKTF
jgi:ubiquinone biosynthesis O-methyltransferase